MSPAYPEQYPAGLPRPKTQSVLAWFTQQFRAGTFVFSRMNITGALEHFRLKREMNQHVGDKIDLADLEIQLIRPVKVYPAP